jgi:tRNA A37 methylthiotransferase MiaB
VAFDFSRALVGKSVEVLVEAEGTDSAFEGRTYMDAPEVDCRAMISVTSVEPGDIASLRVIDTDGYDLILG